MRYSRRGIAGRFVTIFPYLFLLVIVVSALAWGTSLFFGSEVDVRAAESAVLAERLERCLIDHGVTAVVDDWSGVCGLVKETVEEYFVVKLCVASEKECADSSTRGELVVGNNHASCEFVGRNEHFPRCVSRVVDLDEGKHELLVGSTHRVRRVAA